MIEILERDGEAWSVEDAAALVGAVKEMGAYHALAAEYVVDGRPACLEVYGSAADDQFTYYVGGLMDAVTGEPLRIPVDWDEERTP